MNPNILFHYSGDRPGFTMCNKDCENEPLLQFAWGARFSELYDKGFKPRICPKCEAENEIYARAEGRLTKLIAESPDDDYYDYLND